MNEPTIAEIRAAARRLDGRVRKTRVIDLTDLAREHGIAVERLYGKAECLQHTGSFKFRGATNRVALAEPRELAAGFVTYSSGNHAAALAAAAVAAGSTLVAVVPFDAPAAKLEAIGKTGTRLVNYDSLTQDRDAIATQIAIDEGRTLVPPYDDYQVIAGQGTLLLELLEQVGPLNQVVVPVGGGGLIAGVAIAAAGVQAGPRVVAAEPSGADDTARSLAAGRRVGNVTADTIADGLRTPIPGRLTFPIVQRLVARVATVPDDAIAATMAALIDRAGLYVEPSGAVALAAVLNGNVPLAPQDRIGVVLSGANVDPFRFEALTSAWRSRDH